MREPGTLENREATSSETRRPRAREHFENGAVTPDDDADRTAVVRLLNEALGTEIVCWLRHRRH
jgi:bacterioferritin